MAAHPDLAAVGRARSALAAAPVAALARYLVAVTFVAFCLFPIYIMLTTALKSEHDIFAWPPRWTFHPTLKSFHDALFVFGGQSAVTFLVNSVVVTALSTAASLTLGAMAAYGLARFRFRGEQQLSFWILSTRFAPPIAFVVPIYLMALRLDLLDTRLVLILLYASMNLSLVIWLLRGFFAEIPREIEEAALVDGYTRLQIFWRVALPLVRPGVITAGILAAIFSWNEFVFAAVLTQTNAATLPVYLSSFSNAMGMAWGEFMAVGVIAVLPITAFTLFLQRHLVRGLTFGAVR